MANPMVIGITGPFGSGKTTAANHLETKGYQRITLSSFLSEELKRRGIEATRANLQDLGNELREKGGPGALAVRALEMMKSAHIQRATIDGIRNLGEIEALREGSNFILLGVFADRDVRFSRIKQMPGREALTREEFDQLDYRDMGIADDIETGLQVAKCFAVSDYFVDSNKGGEDFIKRIDEIIEKK
jgi:dephospho-CoA kinase